MGESNKAKVNEDIKLQSRTLAKYAGHVCLIQSGYFPQNSGSLYTMAYNNVRIVPKNGEYEVHYTITHPKLTFNAHAGMLARRKKLDASVNEGVGMGAIAANDKDWFLRLTDSIFALMPAELVNPEDLEKMLEKLIENPRQLAVRDIQPFFLDAIQIW